MRQREVSVLDAEPYLNLSIGTSAIRRVPHRDVWVDSRAASLGIGTDGNDERHEGYGRIPDRVFPGGPRPTMMSTTSTP